MLNTVAKPIIRIKDVCREVGVCRTTFDKMCKRGDGPPVVRLSARWIGVRRSDLEVWLESRVKTAKKT